MTPLQNARGRGRRAQAGRVSAARAGSFVALVAWLLPLACQSPVARPALPVVARVMGEAVYQTEVAETFAAKCAAVGEGPLSAKALDALWQSSLDEAVIGRLLVHAARDHQVAVLSEELRGALGRLEATEGATGSAAAADGAHEAKSLRSMVERRLLLGKLMAQEVAARVHVDEQEVAALAAAEPARLVVPARVRLRYVTLTDAGGAARALPALERAVRRGEVAAGTGTRAPEMPLEVRDTGWQQEATLPPAVWAAVRDLPAKRLSKPVPFADGVAAFWLVERQPKRTETPAQAQRRLASTLRREREQQGEAELLGRLRAAGQIEWLATARPSAQPLGASRP